MPSFTPADPKLQRAPFDHSDFIFELKMDGFRGVAYLGKNQARLVSRNGKLLNRFGRLAHEIAGEIGSDAVLDGEIAVLDVDGRPKFYDLMQGKGTPVFYCFDVLWLFGEDLRRVPLLDRKRILRQLVPQSSAVILFADHVEERGVDLFRIACERDLEGIVAKRKNAAYGESWFKIRNPVYSQYVGRRELFEKRYAGATTPSTRLA